MKIPAWTKPALYGAGVGAIVCAIVGFSWGGWVTGGSAKDIAAKQSVAAVASALTPYCLQQAGADPATIDTMAALKAASTYNRRGIVEKAGWATPLGADKPNLELAQACQLKLAEAF